MIVDKFKKIEIDNNDLSKYIKQYLESSNYSDSSKRAKSYALSIFSQYHANKQTFFFQVEDINKYRRYLEYKLGKSKLTVRNYLSSLNLFFEYLIELNILEKNPIKRIKYSIKKESNSIKYFTLNEINNYLNNYNNNFSDLRSRLIFLLLINTNLNIDELVNIKRKEIIKLNRSFKILINNNEYPLDNRFNNVIKDYLTASTDSKSVFLLLKHDKDGFSELKSRTCRENIIKIVKDLDGEGQPLTTLKNTSILFFYNKTNSLKKTSERYGIKTKNVLDKYKKERDYFKSN